MNDIWFSRRAGQICAAIVLLIVVAASTVAAPTTAEKPRPDTWAKPIAGKPGLPNLNRVNATLYRSAQPTKEGFVFLSGQPRLHGEDAPIKTVLSLRASHDDKDLLPADSPIRLERIRMKSWNAKDEEVVKFLRIVTTPEMQPVLVHCQHGADRTGTMMAVYRIVVDGWSKDDAIKEMTDGGYGFHPVWQNLISYVQALDVAAIKDEVAKKGSWK
jgi:protein tyrosine/serine phosphatase